MALRHLEWIDHCFDGYVLGFFIVWAHINMQRAGSVGMWQMFVLFFSVVFPAEKIYLRSHEQSSSTKISRSKCLESVQFKPECVK